MSLYFARMWLPLGDRWDLETHLSSLYAPSKGKLEVFNDVLHIILKTIVSIAQQYIVEQIPTLSLPDMCTLAPVHGKAFCARHCEVVEKHSPPIPTDIRGFLHFCGALNNEGAIFTVNLIINYDKMC